MDIVLGAALGAGVCVVLGLYVRARSEASRARDARALETVRDDVARLAHIVSSDTSRLGQRLEGIDNRLTETQSSTGALSREVFERLGDIGRAASTVAEQASQFTSLQDLLKAPTARGGLGEAMLEELLRQVLPPGSYAMQHRFSSGAVVDAVVRAGGKIACIDSKFPLANFRRMCDSTDDTDLTNAQRAFAADVDRHIRDISTRYIVPDEGTLDFAVMYVPAEGVYAEVLRLYHRRRPLFETAIEHRVVPMSPLTMYAYLTTVLFGLRCLRIEANAAAILDFCGRLEQDLERFESEYDTLGRHLGNARARYEEGERRLGRFRDKLERVADLGDDGSRPASVAAGPEEWTRGPVDGLLRVAARTDDEEGEAAGRAAGA